MAGPGAGGEAAVVIVHPAAAAVDAILAALRAEPALDYEIDGRAARVRVDDGPPVTDLDEPDAIGVGLAVGEVPPLTGETRQGLGRRRTESFDVTCAVDCWTGDPSALAERRARAYALLDVVHEVLTRGRDLGGAVMTALVVRHTYRGYQRDRAPGVGAVLEFVVRVRAFR